MYPSNLLVLGKLLIVQALLSARIESQYKAISQCTAGIVFFRTPHSGSDKAVYGKILGNVASTVMNKPASKLLSALQSNSDALSRLTNDFRHQMSNYNIYSFYETKPVGIFKKEVSIVYLFFLRILNFCVRSLRSSQLY
jgi:hypothetical protein